MGIIEIIANELRVDPLKWGYAALSTWQTLALLNDATKAQPVAVHAVDDLALLAALTAGMAELGQLPAEGWSLVNLVAQVTSRHTIDPGGAPFQAMVAGIFPASQYGKTNAALLGLATRGGSRAEALGGAGTVLSVDEVQAAREAAGLT